MSHRIIITSAVTPVTPVSVQSESEQPSSIAVEVTYTPSHDLTPEQVGDRVTKILKKIAQMSE